MAAKAQTYQTKSLAVELNVLCPHTFLDPTCGSGTTAYVAEQRGRRWITCDTSRVALALARTRSTSAARPLLRTLLFVLLVGTGLRLRACAVATNGRSRGLR